MFYEKLCALVSKQVLACKPNVSVHVIAYTSILVNVTHKSLDSGKLPLCVLIEF